MSSGHRHHDHAHGINTQTLERYIHDPEVQKLRWSRWPSENDEYDIPYLAGYSRNGKIIYFDRHLPTELTLKYDGKQKIFNPRDFVRIHEEWEWIFETALAWSYERSHEFATAMERREVLQRLGPGLWPAYSDALKPYIKADEHERIQKVPADLDMQPYVSPPVSRSLVAHMQEKMGKPRKFTKEETNYSDTRGGPNRRCGPVQSWSPAGVCGHYESPNQCLIVKGFIKPRGGCDKWEAIDPSLREAGVKQIGEQKPEPMPSLAAAPRSW